MSPCLHYRAHPWLSSGVEHGPVVLLRLQGQLGLLVVLELWVDAPHHAVHPQAPHQLLAHLVRRDYLATIYHITTLSITLALALTLPISISTTTTTTTHITIPGSVLTTIVNIIAIYITTIHIHISIGVGVGVEFEVEIGDSYSMALTIWFAVAWCTLALLS